MNLFGDALSPSNIPYRSCQGVIFQSTNQWRAYLILSF